MKRLLSWRPVRLAVKLALLYNQCAFSRSAAALAYFLLLTLFPLLLCVSHFIGVFHLDLAQLLQSLHQLLPGEALTVLHDYLDYAASSRSLPLFWAALFTILISASAGLRTVFHTMDQLFCYSPRHPVLRFLFSPVLALFFLLAIYLSIAVLFTGDWFFLFLETHLPPSLARSLPLDALGQLWGWMRYLLLFCSMLLLVLIVYRVGIPRPCADGAAVLSASISAALGLVICSAVFSWFIGMSSRYALVYGSLAGLVVLLVWLYSCGIILLLGAGLCRVLRP